MNLYMDTFLSVKDFYDIYIQMILFMLSAENQRHTYNIQRFLRLLPRFFVVVVLLLIYGTF